MRLTFARAWRYGLRGLFWAFQDDLYDGRHATLSQLSEEVSSATQAPPPR